MCSQVSIGGAWDLRVHRVPVCLAPPEGPNESRSSLRAQPVRLLLNRISGATLTSFESRATFMRVCFSKADVHSAPPDVTTGLVELSHRERPQLASVRGVARGCSGSVLETAGGEHASLCPSAHPQAQNTAPGLWL